MLAMAQDKSAVTVAKPLKGLDFRKSTPLVATSLTQHHIRELISGEIDAIRINEFYPKKCCPVVTRVLKRSSLKGCYPYAPLIQRVGRSMGESQASKELRNEYWDKGLAWMRTLRELCAPLLSPIDKLRLELDEAWPDGASQACFDEKRAFVGLARIFGRGANAELHQDCLEWILPKNEVAQMLLGQLSANIYLQMPKSGGGLVLTRTELTYKEYRKQASNGYGVPPNSSMDVMILTPEEGELILFNSRRLHGVEQGIGQARVAWSCFLGIPRLRRPIQVWS